MITRTLRIGLEVAGVLVAGVTILAGLAVWRLQQGPIDLDILTPYLERAMEGGPLQLDIGSTMVRWDGVERPFDLVVADVRVRQEGRTLATIPEMAISLGVADLLRGRPTPTRIVLIRPSVRVTRTADGAVSFGLGEEGAAEAGAGGEDVFADLLDALDSAPGTSDHPMASLAELSIERGRLSVVDEAVGIAWRAPRADITLVRDRVGIAASARLDVEHADGTASVAAVGRYRFADRLSDVDLSFRDVVPAHFSHADPLLAPLSVLHLPVAGTAALSLDPGFNPTSVAFDLAAGSGLIDAAPLFAQPVSVAGLTLRGSFAPPQSTLVIDSFTVDLGGPRIVLAARAVDEGGTAALSGTIEVTSLPVDLAGAYWPADVARGARRWVTANVDGGIIAAARAEAAVRLPLSGVGEPEISRFDGTFGLEGANATLLEGLPRATGVGGTATFDASRFDLVIDRGQIEDITIERADIVITGLSADDQDIDIDAAMAGPAATLMRILDSPRLDYAQRFGIDPEATRGEFGARLRTRFPLIAALDMDDVAIGVAGRIAGGAVGALFAGLDLSGIDADLTLDGTGLAADGTALLNGVPARFDWRESFVPGEPSTTLTASALLTDDQRALIGMPDYDGIIGTVAADVEVVIAESGVTTIKGKADLSDALVSLPVVGWPKPAGFPGSAGATVVLGRGGVLSGVPSFEVDLPALKASGSAEIEGGRASRIVVDSLLAGESSLVGEVRIAADGGIAVRASGPALDARPFLHGSTHGQDSASEDDGSAPLDIALDVERLVLGEGKELRSVDVEALRRGGEWSRVVARAVTATGAALSISYRPQDRQPAFVVETADAGSALSALGIVDTVEGGRLRIVGDPGAGGLEGSATVEDFVVVDAPALARLLSALSLGGLQNLLSTDGLRFDRLLGDWRFASGVLTMIGTRASGGALGLTIDGTIDAGSERIDAEGTIVPVYGVNRLIGAIPLVGDLLTGGEGQGLFAFAYSIAGPLADPSVSVNPLSVLAPGFLRNLFFLEGSREEDVTGPTPAPG